MNDLKARLTRVRHQEEDLEVKVLVLEKEHQVLESENRSLTAWLSHEADQQKGMFPCLALLMLSVINCLHM